jgi:hypothetical protein
MCSVECKWPWPIQDPHIPCAKSHVLFPPRMLYQIISPSPGPCERFVKSFLQWGLLSTSPKPQAGVPPLVGCLRLLIQYIHSYISYLEAVPPSATWGRAVLWWQGPTYQGTLEKYSCTKSGRLVTSQTFQGLLQKIWIKLWIYIIVLSVA